MLEHVHRLVAQGRLVEKWQVPDGQHHVEDDAGRQCRHTDAAEGPPRLRQTEQQQRRHDHGQQEVLQHMEAEQVVVPAHVDRRLERQDQDQQATGKVQAREWRPCSRPSAVADQPGISTGQCQRAGQHRGIPLPRPEAEARMQWRHGL